ncbi:MAG TPA: hypothetical protein VGL10_08980, partial [Gammaproteobacteria bacterium]
MIATGSGDDQEKAKSRALSNLAKIFEVQIDESGHDETTAWSKTVGDERKQGNDQLVVRYLDSYTSKLLEGAKTAETWFDEEAGLYYSLAVLERGPLSNRLSADIRKNDQYTQSIVTEARNAGDPFKSARYLFRARGAQVQREALQRDLRIVDPTGVGIRPLWTVKQLDADIDGQLKRMQVGVTAPAVEPVVELAQYLQAGIAAAGMTHAATKPVYQLEGKLDVQDPRQADGWYWLRGSLEISLRTADGKRTLVTERWPLKVSGVTLEQAAVRLRDQLQQRLALELKTALLGVKQQQN